MQLIYSCLQRSLLKRYSISGGGRLSNAHLPIYNIFLIDSLKALVGTFKKVFEYWYIHRCRNWTTLQSPLSGQPAPLCRPLCSLLSSGLRSDCWLRPPALLLPDTDIRNVTDMDENLQNWAKLLETCKSVARPAWSRHAPGCCSTLQPSHNILQLTADGDIVFWNLLILE